MLTTLLALFSSSGVGSILGLLGGILNRKIDIQAKAQDNDFELKKMDKQKDLLELEAKSRVEVATVEGEALVESEGMKALTASYNFAAPTKEDGWVNSFSKTVRPFLTLAFFFLTVYIFYQIHILVEGIATTIPQKDLVDIYKTILEWIFFQAGVSIGWWFAMRPGKVPNFKGGK